uniref:Endoplasmic reticulum resident protein 27 n=1 Tax=Cyprinus carpio TaxID=7962 RepID=A0A8C2IAZ8_CYPCA
MIFLTVFSLLTVCVTAGDEESGSIIRLKDVPAAEAFIDSVEVAVIGFFETEAARGYKEFLAAVKQMETLPVALCSEKEVWAKYGIASDTISIFRKTAVGLFQSSVKTHLLLMADGGREHSEPLQQRFRDLAPKYAGKMLFVLVNGREKSNTRVLEYFGLKSRDLPRIGIYDGVLDKKWLMAPGEITTERVQNFCDSFLDGDLQKQKEAETPEDKTEL